MEISDLHPIAIIAGILGVVIGFIMIKRLSGAEYTLGLIWRVLTPIACGAASWFMVQKMAG